MTFVVPLVGVEKLAVLALLFPWGHVVQLTIPDSFLYDPKGHTVHVSRPPNPGSQLHARIPYRDALGESVRFAVVECGGHSKHSTPS